MTRRFGTLLAAVVVVGIMACTALVPVNCPEPRGDGRPGLTCDVAMAAARTRLAGVTGVTELTFGWGVYCPPGAHCPLLADDDPSVGWVEAARGDEPALVITLERRDDGAIRASEPVSFDLP
jgi:hypothetical protein